MPEDDEQARRERAESLRRAIDEAGAARPGSPREFTEREARKEAERAREGAEDDEDEEA